MQFETLAVHAAAEPVPQTRALAAAIQLSTTFERAPDGSFPSSFVYIRDGNPNREALERAMAALEGGASAIAFSSGMAATMAVFQTLKPSAHVVVLRDAYFGTSKLLREHFIPWGLGVSCVDMTDLAAIQAAVRPHTRLIWTETPFEPHHCGDGLKSRRVDRQVNRRAHGLRQYLGHPLLTEALDARRRYRDALHDKVSFRSLRRHGRSRRHSTRRSC